MSPPEGAQITAPLQTLMAAKGAHTHAHTQVARANKPALHTSPLYTHTHTHTRRGCDGRPALSGHPTVQTASGSSHVACRAFQTAGQEGRTAAPHALASSPPPPSPIPTPGLTSSLTHCLSLCRTATLRRAPAG